MPDIDWNTWWPRVQFVLTIMSPIALAGLSVLGFHIKSRVGSLVENIGHLQNRVKFLEVEQQKCHEDRSETWPSDKNESAILYAQIAALKDQGLPCDMGVIARLRRRLKERHPSIGEAHP